MRRPCASGMNGERSTITRSVGRPKIGTVYFPPWPRDAWICLLHEVAGQFSHRTALTGGLPRREFGLEERARGWLSPGLSLLARSQAWRHCFAWPP